MIRWFTAKGWLPFVVWIFQRVPGNSPRFHGQSFEFEGSHRNFGPMLSAFRCQDDWTSTLLAVDSDVLEQTALEGRWWKNKTGNSGGESHHIFSHNSLLKLIHHLKLYHSVHHSPYLQTWKLARQSTAQNCANQIWIKAMNWLVGRPLSSLQLVIGSASNYVKLVMFGDGMPPWI